MKKWISKPENLFIVIGFICGVLYLVITPPFQVADEDRHFYRAYQVAEGGWLPVTHDGQVGGWLPKSVVKSGSSTSYMKWNTARKITRHEIISQFHEPLSPEERVFMPFRSSAYTPAAYLPAAVFMRIGIACKFSPILLMYTGRMVNLICWLLLIWFSIRIVPFFKWVLLVVALTPMSFYQAASLSADSITNALAFLTIAYFVYWIYGPEMQIKPRHIFLFFLLTVSLSCTKNVFFLISFLLLLIPSRKFVNKKRYCFIFLALATANMAVCFIWYEIVKKMPIGWKPDIFPEQQVTFILTHPIAYTKVFITSVIGQIESYVKVFIGRFGWMDTPLPKWHYHIWGLFLLLTILTDGCRDIIVRGFHKVIYFFIFSAIFTLIVTLLYIYWNPVGAEKMLLVQGRYFIPIAPLFFLCFYNNPLRYDSFVKPVFIGFVTILSLANALFVIYNRFYV